MNEKGIGLKPLKPQWRTEETWSGAQNAISYKR